jgi:replicative DNA helicase
MLNQSPLTTTNPGDSTIDLGEHHIGYDWTRYEDFRLRKKVGLSTGFSGIDRHIRGLPGLTTLVGQTGLGKSYFTMNVYLFLARQGIPVILVDKEIGFVDIRTRILCSLSGLTEAAITSGKFRGNEETKYLAAVEEIKELPIYYFDDIAPEDVENTIIQVGTLHRKRVFLVIDSLNRLIRDFENRRGDIDQWMTLFNNLKLKYDNRLNIWVIAEKNKEGEVKESNTVEFITELWLDMVPTKDTKTFNLVCKKQRNGPRGTLATMTHKLPFCYTFEEDSTVPDV